MKRNMTLRTQLTLMMAALVLLQGIAFSGSLYLSKVFSTLDTESYRLFNSATNTRAVILDNFMGQLVKNMAAETEALSSKLSELAEHEGIAAQELYKNPDAYISAAELGAKSVMSLLHGNNITGAFIILNGSGVNPEDPQAHSAVYIRDSAPDNTAVGITNFLLEIGPIAVSQQNKIATSVNWDLDIKLDETSDFFTLPQQAAIDKPYAELERYGYWSTPISVLGDGLEAVYYTMPLIDNDGTTYGIVGLEISLLHFTQSYLWNTDLPYENSFYALCSVKNNSIQTDWIVPGGPLASVYLSKNNDIELGNISESELYQVKLEGLGDMYCSVQDIVIYSENSPFSGDGWSLVSFVPKDLLNETSGRVSTIVVVSMASTFVAAFVAIFILTGVSTRRISKLSKHVKSLSPNQDIEFSRTGMREIDELTAALAVQNRNVRNASKTTSRILEMTLMPIGGFELYNDSEYVNLTEYIFGLLHLDSREPVTKRRWGELYSRLISRPMDKSDNIFEYADEHSAKRWLRIVTTPTEAGEVGVILDVTKDVEERRRLANELDYDELTRLYNRTAFKREAYQMVRDTPYTTGAMIFMDLDNLKYINDTFGHDMGDRLLITAGEMFSRFEEHGAVVSRISGDEFAIYIHGYESLEDLRKLIKEEYQKYENTSITASDGSEHKIRFSAGIAWYPMDSEDITDLLKLSDYAMYEAKHNCKGSVFEFDRVSYMKNAHLLENREAINRLLDEKLFRFAYQPIVDLKSGEVYAYEMLMRPTTKDFESPVDVLKVAGAETRLGQLESTILMEAFKNISELAATTGNRKFFINSIPGYTLSQDEVDYLRLNYFGLFNRVFIEVTEAESGSPESKKKKIDFIRESGIQLAVDDYGSSRSSEPELMSLAPDIVKVDMSRIQGIHSDQAKQKFVGNLAAFCHSEGMKLVAEGVEYAEDLRELAKIGIDYVQGYYTGVPEFSPGEISSSVRNEIIGNNRGQK